MKITRVETVVVNAEMRNWIFVKVETDNAVYSDGARPVWSGRHARWSGLWTISLP